MRRSRLDLKLFEFSTSHQISLHVGSPETMSGCSHEQTTDEPAPSLHTHYRRLITTTGWSASVSASVLDTSQFPLPGALPLTPASTFPANTGAVSAHAFPRFI